MPSESKELLLLLGKSCSDAKENETALHPAICHMVDVGVAAEALVYNRLPAFAGKALCCSWQEAVRWLGLLAALHDIGKLIPGFQRKFGVDSRFRKNTAYVKRLCRYALNQIRDVFPFCPQPEREESDHAQASFELLPSLLQKKFACSAGVATGIGRAVAGHHGSFPGKRSRQHRKWLGDNRWDDVRKEAIDSLLYAFDLKVEDFPFQEQECLDGAFLIYLSGLTAVADWIGSDEDRFDLIGIPDTLNLKHYRQTRLSIAQQAIEELRLHHSPLASGKSDFSALFPFPANTTQKATDAMGYLLRDGRGLLIIETPMGSGKTEAALAVTDRWIREYGTQGLYYALPTQATGNKMFSRVKTFLHEHPALQNTELHLLHAFSAFQEEYESIRINSIHGKEADADISAQAWFTGRKLGLLSPFAVGTIDQALLGVLQVRHMFVRMYGLSNKVIIIDEVHAYDTYTSEILDRMLMWLAALDTPVIVLSATLPKKRRKALLNAYYGDITGLDLPQYPCVIGINAKGSIDHQQVQGLPEQGFGIEPLCKNHQWCKLTAEILEHALQDGGCAACILNTVDDAQELFAYLQDHPGLSSADTRLILFHARFPLHDRLRIEQSIDDLFGSGESLDQPNPDRPKRAIVVSTQVMEQSLDVDFDWMLTDLAPVDLMLQRAGRLHRHEKNNQHRPGILRNPKLYYLQPDLSKELDEEHPEKTFGGSAYVYEPAILLRTTLTLGAYSRITLPGDLQENSLIEQIYGSDLPDCQDHLQDILISWDFLANWSNSEEGKAARKYILPKSDQWEDGDEILDKLAAMEDDEFAPARVRAQTRLARPSVMLIVLHQIEDGVFLDCHGEMAVKLDRRPDHALMQHLVKNSITISNPVWYGYFTEKVNTPPSWEKSSVLRYAKPAIFRGGKIQNGSRQLLMDSELGLIYHPRRYST